MCVLSDTHNVIHECKLDLFNAPTSPQGGRRPGARPTSPLSTLRRVEGRGRTWTLCHPPPGGTGTRGEVSTLSTSLCVSPCGSCGRPPAQCEPTNTPSLSEGGLHDRLTLNYDTLQGKTTVFKHWFGCCNVP